MEILGELFVRLAELAEAEGRVLRRALFRLAGSLLLLCLAMTLGLAAAAFFLVAILLALSYALGPAAAFAITGGVLIVVVILALVLAAWLKGD
ncbi:MAG: hypothetical protein ACOCTI_01350 [Phycisphaeraceae bacterium]